MLRNISSIIGCPECNNGIREIHNGNTLLGFYCENCELVYPTKDDIYILLPKKSRNFELEYPLINQLKEQISPSNKYLNKYISNTLTLLESSKTAKTWEWEDEAFWNGEYKKDHLSGTQKVWNERIWQRQLLVDNVFDKNSFKGKIIVDCGSGEGQNFRLMLSNYCDDESLYIAIDISMEGLKLDRTRNTHKNSIYILGNIDKLPLQKNSVDAICYFGILHHTEKKEHTIIETSEFINSNGYIILHEALERPSLLPNSMKLEKEESVHEERLDLRILTKCIESQNSLRAIKSIQISSIFFGGIFRFFTKAMLKSKKLFYLVMSLDILLIQLLSKIIPYFRPAEIMIVMKKQEPSSNSISRIKNILPEKTLTLN